jgi:hypothetical protein
VLEVMKVLEDEMALREETRVTEKARAALENEVYGKKAQQLAKTQGEIAEHVDEIVKKIEELEDGAAKFGKEIGLLNQVKNVMVVGGNSAKALLSQPSTGADSVAAETEAIELLLKAKRVKPGGGGGGGSNPGGGGGGTTQSSALAQLGNTDAKQAKPLKRTVGQSTGKAGKKYPEEFRNGLDEYFKELEKSR